MKKIYFHMMIDALLTIILLFQMMYIFVNERIHEYLGITMFLLFIIHLYLNRAWIKNIFKGQHSLFRITQIAINLCILICMILLMMSAVMISEYVFVFLNIYKGLSFARLVHMAAAYWGFVLMSLHLGLHWSMILNLFLKKRNTARIKPILLRSIGIIIFLCGIYFFQEQNLLSYMFLKNQFVFFDMSISPYLFLIKFIIMMGAFVYIGYQIKRVCEKCKKNEFLIKS